MRYSSTTLITVETMPATVDAGPALLPASATRPRALRPAVIWLVIALVMLHRAKYTLAVTKRRLTACLPAAYTSSGSVPLETPSVIIATWAAVNRYPQ